MRSFVRCLPFVLFLLGGCVTRERVVAVEGPAPGYQGYAPAPNQAAYRIYPDYRPVPVAQQAAAVPMQVPLPNPVAQPPVGLNAALPTAYVISQPVAYGVNPPFVNPPPVTYRPNVVFLPTWPVFLYGPTYGAVYRSHGIGFGIGGYWPLQHYHYSGPHHFGHGHHWHPHGHPFGSHHHH